MKTTENNILIAEFLGEKKQPFNFPQHGTLRLNGEFKTEFFSEQLKFHSNWNWLMEVVEKIEKTTCSKLFFSFEIKKDSVSLFYSHIDDLEKQVEMYFEWGQKTKIDNTYKVVVEFIKWYNEQN